MFIGKVGFRVFEGPELPDLSILNAFRNVPTSHIADALCGFHAMHAGFKAVSPETAIVGPALTVLTRPGDNLMLLKALQVARPGEIMVVQTCGGLHNAVFGELLTAIALKVGLAGLIVDGAIRDVDAIRQTGFPVFARSFVTQACDKDGPGEINVPISCGGVAVLPGDIVTADRDGIVVIPCRDAMAVRAICTQIADNEAARMEQIEGGELFPESLERLFQAKGISRKDQPAL